MINRVNNQKGFTLVELAIVVTVIGILATLAVVVYTSFLKQARTVEARSFLSALNRQETAYYVGNGKYTDDINNLGLPTLGTLRYYTDISVALPNVFEPQSYIATAKGNIDDDALLDEWTIDENQELINTVSDIDN